MIPSDLVVDDGRILLAHDITGPSRIQDIKTQFRRDVGNCACFSVSNEEQPITTFEAMVYLYVVLLRRAKEELPHPPDALRITIPALAFSSSEDLQDRYRDVIVRAYDIAGEISGPWDSPIPISDLRRLHSMTKKP